VTIGVLVMAYGTPSGPGEIEAYYTDVRRGRPPSPEQLADLERRYAAIGGLSPLTTHSRAQIAALENALEARAPGVFRAYYGTKHADPRLEAAVEAAAADGMTGLVGLVLAPHYSSLSVGEYIARAAERAAALGLPATFLEHWHEEPTLIALLAERVEAARAAMDADPDEIEVVFSAHSLPARIIETGDPYPAQLQRTAELVAHAAGIAHWRTGWQSAGRTPEPWLGPDILALIDSLAVDGRKAVLVAPVGFTSDHLEVLYDLDIEAKARADSAGIEFARTASLNDDARLFEALATVVEQLAATLPNR
jgi:protoporphyrin/coproporphyrin ferrochelatase